MPLQIFLKVIVTILNLSQNRNARSPTFYPALSHSMRNRVKKICLPRDRQNVSEYFAHQKIGHRFIFSFMAYQKEAVRKREAKLQDNNLDRCNITDVRTKLPYSVQSPDTFCIAGPRFCIGSIQTTLSSPTWMVILMDPDAFHLWSNSILV